MAFICVRCVCYIVKMRPAIWCSGFDRALCRVWWQHSVQLRPVVPLLVTLLIKLICIILRGIVMSRVGTKRIQSQLAMNVRVGSRLGCGTFIVRTFREHSLQGTILHQSGLSLSFKIRGFVLLPVIYILWSCDVRMFRKQWHVVLNLLKAYWLPDAPGGWTFIKTASIRIT
jgi:hypothetical protein